jgi:DNA-directed RNA polymerase alpha subunit
MSEIQDLKNYIMAIQQQLNNLTIIIQNHSKKDDNLNEILNLVHNQNFEKARFNQSLFENVFPDIVHRISVIEHELSINRRKEQDREMMLLRPIHTLGLMPRTLRGLLAEGVHTISDLIKLSSLDILKMVNMGKKSLDDILHSLAIVDLTLRANKDERKI